MDTPEIKTEGTTLELLCRWETIIRKTGEGLRHADRLKRQGRWQPKWDEELQALQLQHEDAQRELAALDRMLARTMAAAPL
jgi:hypothetical protein